MAAEDHDQHIEEDPDQTVRAVFSAALRKARSKNPAFTLDLTVAYGAAVVITRQSDFKKVLLNFIVQPDDGIVATAERDIIMRDGKLTDPNAADLIARAITNTIAHTF